MISIKAHHISVHFDNMSHVYDVEKVKSKFMVMKNIFVFRKQFPLILALHKCQGLSLDCAMMDLSDEVFSPGMAYVALSRVKRLENLHLIAFNPQSVIVSSKSLQEVAADVLPESPAVPCAICSTQGTKPQTEIEWHCCVNFSPFQTAKSKCEEEEGLHTYS